ncbi:terminase small subunit-like protein [Flavobacterium daemonense]|uniref:terminase small subunit-like protein n=1 Tax=Flavobacterium daemonense TaxID=1393049 RepID=UPI001185BE04|nr:hypothetical protein [Flavobacterium daemonense]KAF2337240.1 hypothetical protein FND99_02165 [Flavobacterium daemonense]
MNELQRFTDDQRLHTFQRICDDVANGVLVTVALEQNGVTSYSTFQYWINQDPSLRMLWEDTQRMRETFLFDEAIRIAYSDSPKTIKEYRGGELIKTTVKDSAEDRRLKINTIKWALSKMNPAKYGEKVIVEPDTSKQITSIQILGFDEITD